MASTESTEQIFPGIFIVSFSLVRVFFCAEHFHPHKGFPTKI
jgi:hypothetical protein